MVATSRICMADISRQNRFEVDLNGDLTPRHTVGHAIEHYLGQTGIRSADLRWTAFERGRKLDNKTVLADLPDTEDNAWTIMPEISAG